MSALISENAAQAVMRIKVTQYPGSAVKKDYAT
jgi:hypothetical protein